MSPQNQQFPAATSTMKMNHDIRLRSNQQRHQYDNLHDSPATTAKVTTQKRNDTDSSVINYQPRRTRANENDPHEARSVPMSRSNDHIDGSIDANISAPNSPHGRSSHEASKVLIFGFDISHFSRKLQFITCASGVFSFSLLYGFLQELISVKLCDRQLGLFLAMVQFMGYTIWSQFLSSYVQRKHVDKKSYLRNKNSDVPTRYYVMLAILRAIDASMTNMAMAYVNYPAKTLMKSSRVVFTMLFSTIVSQKQYKLMDYLVVLLMVTGLVIFMHADSNSSAVFEPIGIIMLTTSLCCDAVLTNFSEKIMNQYNVGQDKFIFKLYSLALVGIMAAATVRGDLFEGTRYLFTPGTYSEIMEGREPTWSVHGKIFAIILFSSTGFLGSSCSALITKEFGALTMSITSTARKATTLFLSFALFNNVCTKEHIEGIFIFIVALVGKSIRASRGHSKGGGVGDGGQYKREAEAAPLLSKSFELGSNSASEFGAVKRRNRAVADIV